MFKNFTKYTIFFLIISIGTYAQNGTNDQIIKSKVVSNNNFEGIIKFVQLTFSDTLDYTYYVKGDYVKLVINENCNECETEDEAMIFNLKDKTITALKPSLHMYKNIPIKPYVEKKVDDFIITQNPRNFKKINGYKCIQWRVKNKKEKTEISYWVAKDNFYFFDDYLKLWNRAEKHSRYYLQIPNVNGYFPMVSVERTTLREKRMQLDVISIEEKKLDSSIFEIPLDYKEL
jgi:hypothetical protein